MSISKGILVGVSTCLVWVGLGGGHGALGEAVYSGGDRIEVGGIGNTLSSVAADIGKPQVFSYDAATKTAVSTCSLSVLKDGELTLGSRQDDKAGETLKIACAPELGRNSRRVWVKGALNLYHSHILGEGSPMGAKGRYRLEYGVAYDFHAQGGEIVNSVIASAATGLRIYEGARVSIDNLRLADCETGLSSSAGGTVIGLDTAGTVTGVVLSKPNVFDLKRCVFGNSEIRLLSHGKPATVNCTDCALDRNRIWINDASGESRLWIQWTQFAQLVTEQDYALPAVYLRLSGQVRTESLPLKLVKTNAGGEAWLEVPECVVVQAMRYGKGYTSLDVAHALAANLQGTGPQGYTSMKRDWTPRANGGARWTQRGEEFIEEAIAYREGLVRAGQEVVNLCPNSSFELATIKGFPDYWYSRHFYEMKRHGWGVLHRAETNLVFYGIDATDPFHGKNALQVPPGMTRLVVRGCLRWFIVRHPYLECWDNIKSVVGEIRQLAPMLLAEEVEQNVEVKQPSGNAVYWVLLEHEGRRYSLAANSTKERVEPVTFTVPDLMDGSAVKVWFEDRDLRSTGGSFSDAFEGYERHVYALHR